MILYHDTSSMVRSPDGDTDFFDNSAAVLQGDTLEFAKNELAPEMQKWDQEVCEKKGF